MKRTILKIVTFLICIGVVAMAINTIFGNETVTYLTKEQIDMVNGTHFYIWKFDFWKYIENVQLSIQNVNEFTLNLPTRSWSSTDIANNIAIVVDYIIVVINVLLYPLRIGAYLLNNVLALLGLSADMNAAHNGLKWLYTFVDKVIGIEIPYI